MRRTDLKDLGTLLPCVLLLSPGRILVLSFCSIVVRKINRFTSKQRTVWIKMATLWLCFPKPLLRCHSFWSCTFQTERKATSVNSASAGEHLGQAECPDVLSAPLPAQPPRPTPRSKCWWQGQVVGAGPYLYQYRPRKRTDWVKGKHAQVCSVVAGRATVQRGEGGVRLTVNATQS